MREAHVELQQAKPPAFTVENFQKGVALVIGIAAIWKVRKPLHAAWSWIWSWLTFPIRFHRIEEKVDDIQDHIAVQSGRQKVLMQNSAADEGVFFASADGGMTEPDFYCEALFLAPAEDILGTGWQNFVVEADQEKVQATWARLIPSGAPFRVNCMIQRGNGQVVLIRVKMIPIRANGQLCEWAGRIKRVAFDAPKRRLGDDDDIEDVTLPGLYPPGCPMDPKNQPRP